MASSRSAEIVASQQAERELRRLFVLGVKELNEDELRSIFEQFGTLTELKKTYDKKGADRGEFGFRRSFAMFAVFAVK